MTALSSDAGITWGREGVQQEDRASKARLFTVLHGRRMRW